MKQPLNEQFRRMQKLAGIITEGMEGGTQYDILQNGEGGEDFFQDKEEIVQYFERRGILNFELEDGEQISVEDGVDRMMNGETLVVTNEELVEMGDDYAEWSVEEV